MSVGTTAAARSAPDGYTCFFATAATLVSDPYTFKTLPYDPVKDFVRSRWWRRNPFLILAHPSVPAKNAAGADRLRQGQPGQAHFATDGQRHFSGMIASWLNKLARRQHACRCPTRPCRKACRTRSAGRTQLTIRRRRRRRRISKAASSSRSR